MKITKFLISILTLTLIFSCALQGPAWCYTQKTEEDLGRKYSKEAEETCKILSDSPELERVKRIGETLAKIANEVEVPARYGSSEIYKFKYKFNVVEDKDINAFSLPSGIIYVNTGLLELAKSDDELAGVLAHEIAHASHHHMMHLMKKQTKVDRYVALIALAGILGNLKSQDLNNLIYGAQLIKTGKLSSYTMEAEKDADRTASTYMVKSPYNPEGLVTFMKKLEEKQEENPTLPLGIFQTHPAPFRRVISITNALKEEGINISARKIRDISYAKPEPVKDGSDQYQVIINKKPFYIPANLSGGLSSKIRAENIASKINSLLDSGAMIKDIKEDEINNCIIANGKEVLKVEAEDAALAGNNDKALLSKTRSALAYAIWAEWLSDGCPAVQDPALSQSD